MPSISLNGLASGLDTGTMIEQLMALERRGRTKLEFKQINAQAQTDSLADVSTKLNDLKFRAQDLKASALWKPTQTVEVADPTKLSAKITGGAGPGASTVGVLALASSSQRTYTFTPPAADETWTFGATNVNITTGMTIDEAVSAVNGVAGGVIAVNAGGKLVVSSTTTGAASAFTWSAASLAQDSEKIGTDAQYRIDGGATQTSASNTVTTAIPGVELTLKSLTAGDVGVNITAPTTDQTQVIAKLKGFVDAYNAVNDKINSLISDRKVTSPANSTEARRGSLYADSGLRSLQSALRTAVSDAVGGLANANLDQLGELGISTGASTGAINADAVAGKLVFDEAKFSAALAANPTDVRALLGGLSGTDGIAQRFETFITPYTQVGGVLSNRRTETDADLQRIRDSIERFDDRLEFKERRLRAQFERMETLLARQNANGSALTNALAGLGSGR